MSRMATMLVFLLATGVSTTGAQSQTYGWAISSSGTDPLANSGAVTGGPQTLYLWLYCATPDGMSAAEFDVQLPPGVLNFGFSTQNGFLNAGTSGSLLLAVGACPAGPVVAGAWTVFNTTAGDYCLVPSGGGTMATVDCDIVTPTLSPIGQRGYSTAGTAACTDDLCVVAVESVTWGGIKSLYR